MTLYKLVQDVCNLGKALPNVNFVTQGDIYQLNHNQDVDYPAFVVTLGTHTGSDYDEEQFTLTLFAVDRLVSDKSNEIDVQSWANSVLLSVIKNIGDFYIGTVLSGFKIQTFTEKFDSLCAGAYVTLAINVDINDCDCVSKSIGFVTSVNGQTGDVYLNIPYKVSDLLNDVPYASESFVNNKITDVSTYVSNNYLKNGEVPVLDNYYTKQEVDDKIRDVSVDVDLSNYYTKQETYNKQEIETKIGQAGVSSVKSVNGQTGDVVLNYVDSEVYNLHLEEFNLLYYDYFNIHINEYSSLFSSVSDIENRLRNYYTKEETYNKQEIEAKIGQAGVSSVKSVNGQTGDVVLNYVDVSVYNLHLEQFNLLYDDYFNIHMEEYNSLFSSVSDIENRLRNYYTKSETYNKQEIEAKIGQAGVSSVKSVNGQTGDVFLNYVDIEVYNLHLEGSNMMAENVNFLSELFSELNGKFNDTQNILQGKQDTLVSGTNIKTINGQSVLGEGNIDISGGGGESTEHVNLTLTEYNNLSDAEKQNGKVYFITDIAYCLLSDYDRLNDTVISLTNRVKVLENSIKNNP